MKNMSAALRLASDIKSRLQHPASIPVVYFTDRPNVGDLLNEYLIPKISGRNIVKVRSSMQPHLRAVGSVVGSASSFSQIWGSGSIDGKGPKRYLRKENIHALRGHHTLNVVSKNIDGNLNGLPLGDPALLMPLFFNPASNLQEGIGIVPHFSDEEQVRDYLEDTGTTGVKLISVQQGPEDFISQMCACKYIFSSSLHGLILADSYGIPNKWVSFSNKLLGGKFKFRDYYSTTMSPDETVTSVIGPQDLNKLLVHPDKYCAIKSFIGHQEELLSSFPVCYKKDY